MSPPPWQRYVRTLCTDAWDFEEVETTSLLAELERLIRARRVTDGAVVEVLVAAGVSETSAFMIAPSIRVSILS